MSQNTKQGVRRIAAAAFSLVAVAVIVAGLRAAAPGASGSTGASAAVQQIVVGQAAFLAQAPRTPSILNFEDQPANAILTPLVYASRGVTIEQLDGFPIYVGEWRYPQSAMVVPSGTKGISSSWSGVQLPGFSQVCNTPPDCMLFFNDGASDRIRFTFTVPVSAAGIHLGQNDVNGTRVTWYDTSGAQIESRLFPGFQPWSDFVGLVNASAPIGSMVVENAANNGDAVYFDDLMFVPVVTRASDERPFRTEAPPLNAARSGHTTTLLTDGRVLVAGGADGAGTPLASAELYDPALNRWTSVPSMTVPRTGHGAALLGNGLVLVSGGSTATTTTNTAELYDPVANAWRSAGTMAMPRSVHSETPLADGRVLVAGGYTPNTDPYARYANSAELYDPVTNTWTSTGSMQTRRLAHTATLLRDGRVLIAGGGNYAEYLDTAEVFSPATGTWTSAGAMSDRRYGAAAVTRPDGTVLVIGGANFFGRLATTAIFNPAGGWTAGPVMQSARFAPVAVAMGDQKILVAGGHANGSLASAEMLDPAASPARWTPVASLYTARYSAGSAVLLQDGGVLVAGGYDLPAGTTVSSAEIWNSGLAITTLTLDRATGTPGGVVSLTARLTAFGAPVSQRPVLFALNGTAAGTATTNANGVAALSGVSVPNLAPGFYPGAASASVDGDSTSTPSAATADLTIENRNRAPVAAASATPNPAEATSPAGAVVTLDASASSDPDNDSLTYQWSEGTQVLATIATAPVTLLRGTHTVLLKVTDTNGTSGLTSLSITVRDTTAPAVAISASPLLGSAQWYGATLPATAVTVTIAATDGGAGLGAINYSASGAQTIGATSSAAPVGGPPTFSAALNISVEGETTIAATAKDVAGNESASSTFTVRIDRTAPTVTITEPRLGAIYRTNIAQRHAFTCADALAGIVSCYSPSTGGEYFDTFTAGTKTFSVTATDNAGNQATRVVTYTVNTAPVAVATAKFNPAEATSLTGGRVDLSGAASSDVDGSVVAYQWLENGVQIATGPSASLYRSIGTHVFELVVTDDLGGTSSATLMVIVRDSTAPVLTSIPAGPVSEATGPTGAVVTWPAIIATDLVEGDKPVLCAPASGSTFALGQTSVRCESADSRGNRTAAVFTVAVLDTTTPVIGGMPAFISTEATSPAGAAATWTAPTATDLVDGALPVICDRASGSTFALGWTTVTCSVVDRSRNRISPVFAVTVVDTTAPNLLVPPSFALTSEATGPAGAQITFNLTAPDAMSGPVPATCLPVNGTMFPIGVTTVTCSATDAAGNRATISFPYTVRDTTAPVFTTTFSPDAVVTSSPYTFGGISLADAVGVTSVTVNAIAATQTSPGGFWSAKVPVVLPVAPGGALTFTLVAKDAAGNTRTQQVIVDNDGMSGAIDRNLLTGADDSTRFSSDFVSGLTRGNVATRAGHSIAIYPTGFGVIAAAVGPGGTAVIRACSATKEVWLDRDGETADIRCAATGTLRVQAITALPRIEVRKLVTTTTGWVRPRTYQYWSVASLATGQSFSTGSPLTADAENTEPITVTLLQIDDNGIETVIGTVVLDAGEAADVQFVEGQDVPDDRAEVVGLSGDVEVTVAGTSFTIHAGETKTPVVDRTAPVIASVTPSAPVIWPPNGKMVAETIVVRVTDNVDAAPVCRIVGVTSNESVSKDGDWTITGNLTLVLRADRLGGGAGRIYTMTVSCTDVAGNTSTATASVSVPHDQSEEQRD